MKISFGSKKNRGAVLKKKVPVKSWQEALKPVAEKLAKEFYSTLIENIKTNKYGFKNAPATIAKKLAAGVEPIPLKFWGDYVNAIQVKGTRVFVKPGKHYSGLTYNELSFILEHGRRDKKIPSYPVWRYTLRDFMPYARKEMRAAFSQYVRELKNSVK